MMDSDKQRSNYFRKDGDNELVLYDSSVEWNVFEKIQKMG